MLLLDEGDPVFLLDRDGEAAGTFSKHSPGGDRETVNTLWQITTSHLVVPDVHFGPF